MSIKASFMRPGTVVSLCSNNTWCPIVSFDGEQVTIKDDLDGRSITLTKEEWNTLLGSIRNGDLALVT